MGKRLCINKDNGETQYNYEFAFTIDGDIWQSELFEHLDEARKYARALIEQNDENDQLRYFARRIVQVQTSDFLDSRIRAVEMRIISRHSERKGW